MILLHDTYHYDQPKAPSDVILIPCTGGNGKNEMVASFQQEINGVIRAFELIIEDIRA
jgi:hypothetical protein